MSETQDAPQHDPRVDAVLADLDQLAGLPVEEHVQVFETIHAKLREVLAQANQDQASSGAP